MTSHTFPGPSFFSLADSTWLCFVLNEAHCVSKVSAPSLRFIEQRFPKM